ncbi:fasciclin domain-containing protein [Phenylobacterium sp.]|uniref:fasciclin domain-containing protein n=1 Tax=Phenylobacterium sp. TaxID=1871053 RepID=UPI0027356D45|nr:fasciclin domain-containing protein [Phenylobacterium sp.]MDP3659588.1 fasciclin domain-containing protein [Phenylobacterium sp.]
MQSIRLMTTVAAMALTASVAAAQTSATTSAKAPAGKAPAAAPPVDAQPLGPKAPAATGAMTTTPAPATSAPASTAPTVVAKGDLMDTARLSGQFTIFVKAVDATNLTSVLKTNKNLTVFAPTDAAFAALPAGELDRLMADKAGLQKLLTYHIVNARVDSTKIKGAKGPVTTVSGQPIELDGSGDMLMVNNADITQSDVMATNGILHVVDKVLTPGTALAAASSGASASATATDAVPAGKTVPAAPAKTTGAAPQ